MKIIPKETTDFRREGMLAVSAITGCIATIAAGVLLHVFLTCGG